MNQGLRSTLVGRRLSRIYRRIFLVVRLKWIPSLASGFVGGPVQRSEPKYPEQDERVWARCPRLVKVRGCFLQRGLHRTLHVDRELKGDWFKRQHVRSRHDAPNTRSFARRLGRPFKQITTGCIGLGRVGDYEVYAGIFRCTQERCKIQKKVPVRPNMLSMHSLLNREMESVLRCEVSEGARCFGAAGGKRCLHIESRLAWHHFPLCRRFDVALGRRI